MGRLSLGKISKEVLRQTRFKKTFIDLGLTEEVIPHQFEDDYISICPTKTNLFPHTHETLSYFQSKYHCTLYQMVLKNLPNIKC